MISIKQLLEHNPRSQAHIDELLAASLQTYRTILECMATSMIKGRDADYTAFRETLTESIRRMDEPPSVSSLAEVSNRTVGALRTYFPDTSEYFGQQYRQMQLIVGMLTDTVAHISGQSDGAIGRLQAIEREIESARGSADMAEISTKLESCLEAVRRAAIEQRRASAATVERLEKSIREADSHANLSSSQSDTSRMTFNRIPEASESMAELASYDYVAIFQLAQDDRIVSRYGEAARHEMLSMVFETLSPMLEPRDRIFRRNKNALVLFLSSPANINVLRRKLTLIVARIRQRHVELGKNSAMLAVIVNWVLFPQFDFQALSFVFGAVDTFLASGHLDAPVISRK